MIVLSRQLLRAVAASYGKLLMTSLVSAATIAAVVVIGLSPGMPYHFPYTRVRPASHARLATPPFWS